MHNYSPVTEKLKNTISFFQSVSFPQGVQDILEQVDYLEFQKLSSIFTQEKYDVDKQEQWRLFCEYVNQVEMNVSEKFLLLQTAFPFLLTSLPPGGLAQFAHLAASLRKAVGLQLFYLLFKPHNRNRQSITDYLTILQLILDLIDVAEIGNIVKNILQQNPQSYAFKILIDSLHEKKQTYFAEKYPDRNIEETIARFSQDESVQFPLSSDELTQLKTIYLAIKDQIQLIKNASQAELSEKIKTYMKTYKDNQCELLKQEAIAIIVECIRRVFKIVPYDTQLIALLALIQNPAEHLKGRIAQIKTGEGKSTVIAMLAAWMSIKGHFVDIITSSSYLAKRDCEKYKFFYKILGLSTSHIGHRKSKPEHFSGQILYGTNTDFEFALLRDGVYNTKLRYSERDGKLQARTFDVVIVDEADNLFLDTALNSARLAIEINETITWIYDAILNLVKTHPQLTVTEIRHNLLIHLPEKHHEQIKNFTDTRLKQWLESANIALNQKKEKYHYIIKEVDGKKDIVIIDYANTGRLHEGCQWQHGVHQFLQAIHKLEITAESLTAASISHPSYFSLYKILLGLTGTIGEAVERAEIEKMYHVNSFDVPPHFPTLRQRLEPTIKPDDHAQYAQILKSIIEKQKEGRPVLVIFLTVEANEQFSQFLASKNIQHQLLNETQQAAEAYIIARAGDSKVVTVATNNAGRGTDIILSPESKKCGGLHMIFTFYPANLRVEQQGFGRAGRQGQPGSCEMILKLNDPQVLSLIKPQSRLWWKLLHPVMPGGLGPDAHLQSDYYEKRKALDERLRELNQASRESNINEILKLLNQERTGQIKKESQQRYFYSQLEIMYFEKLHQFFSKLNKLFHLFENESFKQTFILTCTTQHQRMDNAGYYSNELLQPLLSNVKLLLNNQMNGNTVDWAYFFQTFKSIYLNNIRQIWAGFYTQMQDINVKDKSFCNNIDELYAKVTETLDLYLNEPEKKIIEYVKNILDYAMTSLIQEESKLTINCLFHSGP